MQRVVTTLQNKGGSGKTTFTVSVGAALAGVGCKVLIVDVDQQRNATILLDPILPDGSFTVYDVVAAQSSGAALEAVYPTAWSQVPEITERGGTLDLLPGDGQFTEQHMVDHGIESLSRALEGAPDSYDVILIDCPPSTGLIVQAALVASSHAVIVSQPQHLSILGLSQSVTLLEQFNETARVNQWDQVALSGVVINQYDSRRTEHREALSEVRSAFGTTCWAPPVPERAVIQKAAAAHFPLMSYPDSAARGVSAVFARTASHLVRSFQDPLMARYSNRLGGEPLTVEDALADRYDDVSEVSVSG